jgi:beta-phosphoglucomutase
MNCPVGALLLDCDGVIAHSEPLNFSCWNDAYEQVLGIRLSGDYRQLVGLNIEAIHALWATGDQSELEEDMKSKLLEIKNRFFYQRAQEHLQAVKGIYALMQQARQRAWPVAVVSAALRKRLEFTLETVGLEGAFDLILAGEDIPSGAEALKDYGRAAEIFSLPPQACVVVEDSAPGVRAARLAGIGRIYGITTSCDEDMLSNAGADYVVNALAEVKLSDACRQPVGMVIQ